MHYLFLTITDKSGFAEEVEYAFADEGKVLAGKDGNTVSYVERAKVDDFIEIESKQEDEPTVEDKAEAYDILTGVSE